MKEMKLVYVAGPYRDECNWHVEKNIRAAEELSYEVAKLGAVAICPHTQSRFFNGTISEQYWIDATMNMLARCDAMIVGRGWRSSSGTLGEIACARNKNIPYFHALFGLETWLKG